jgi:glycosyltransferase involved in cell wall biosynthesis
MIVAHTGPPTGRTGGPAGYLHQLKHAAEADPHPRHDVRFPGTATRHGPTPAQRPAGLSLLTRIRRKVFGPKFYRPSIDDVSRPGGVVDRLTRETAVDIREDTRPSLAAALAEADIIFTHEPFTAEDALARRRSGQQVWMMCHGITPVALYAAWSWALPEAAWQELAHYPDVRTWIDWELGVWSRVDRLIVPCEEAGDSFRTIDPRYVPVLQRAHHVLSGASTPPMQCASERIDGQRRVGLYLGSPEPYRGFDALLSAVETVPRDARLVIAVAGPHPSKVPPRPMLKALGRVEDIAGLLASVDFLINVNRFTLFDLSTIEATEAGKPLLLHAVGGNRAFERLGAGCVMLADLQPPTIADGLMRMASLDDGTLRALGGRSRACWEAQLTPQAMWQRHLALYDTA